jgi:hypothetical protein
MAAILSDSIKAVQDGSAYKPPPGVDDLASIGLPSADAAASSITASWGEATDDLSKTLSVTSTQVKVIELKAKSEGREPTEAELDEACGPLSFLTAVPKALNEALGGILESVNQFASDFGESIGAFAARLNQLTEDLANAIESGIQELIDAAETALGAVNQAAIQALNAVENAINVAVGFVNTALAQAEQLLNTAIDELLGFAKSLNFASLFSLDCQEEALENAVEPEKVADAEEIDRVTAPVEVDSTDETITSETLPVPQTTFTPAAAPAPPPDIDALVASYQRAARALKAAEEATRAAAISAGTVPFPFTRAQVAELRQTEFSTLQELRRSALSEGLLLDSLPIYGPNFDSPRDADTENRTQNASTAEPNGGNPFNPKLSSLSRDEQVQFRTNLINSDIQFLNSGQERQRELTERIRSNPPITPAGSRLIQTLADNNKETRDRIINDLNSLPPEIAAQVRAAVGPIPPLL